jgi:putative hydrolase of the HAD superfamily
MQTKLYIFDMGGVVVHNAAIISDMAASMHISADDFFIGAGSDPKVTHTSPYHLGDVGALMRGDIDSAAFWSNFSHRTGISVRGNPWYDFFNPELNNETAALIQDLRSKGLRVVCGTNTLDVHYQKHQERGDYRIFDEVYASHLMGVIKPDGGFWRYILEKETAAPAESFFTDDLEENIRAARELGIRAEVFLSAEELGRVVF